MYGGLPMAREYDRQFVCEWDITEVETEILLGRILSFQINRLISKFQYDMRCGV